METPRPVDANRLMQSMREAHIGNIPQAKVFDGRTLSYIDEIIRSAPTLELSEVKR